MTNPISPVSTITAASPLIASSLSSLATKVAAIAVAHWPLIAAIAALSIIGIVIYFTAFRYSEQEDQLAQFYDQLLYLDTMNSPRDPIRSIKGKARYIQDNLQDFANHHNCLCHLWLNGQECAVFSPKHCENAPSIVYVCKGDADLSSINFPTSENIHLNLFDGSFKLPENVSLTFQRMFLKNASLTSSMEQIIAGTIFVYPPSDAELFPLPSSFMIYISGGKISLPEHTKTSHLILKNTGIQNLSSIQNLISLAVCNQDIPTYIPKTVRTLGHFGSFDTETQLQTISENITSLALNIDHLDDSWQKCIQQLQQLSTLILFTRQINDQLQTWCRETLNRTGHNLTTIVINTENACQTFVKENGRIQIQELENPSMEKIPAFQCLLELFKSSFFFS
ncbi:MAG: hypothetical protein JW769_05690 [Parachlamydiales bacterium]|nr:hypothetical protein [Parachlamydiales bacterium]